MNERIKKIKELASNALEWPDTDNDGLTVFNNDELEKFAELIVRECIGICEKDGQWYTNTGWLAEAGEAMSLSGQIKKHFGVEE